MLRRVAWLTGILVLDRILKNYFWLNAPSLQQRGGGFLVVTGNPDLAFSLPVINWIIWPVMGLVIFYVIWQAWQQYRRSDTGFFWWGLIIVGALSNILDRLRWGVVVDYIRLGWWPVFNLSDSIIVIGAGVILLQQFRVKEKINKNVCQIYLVRHGQTEWNVAAKLQGHTDSQLTSDGIDQAKAVAKRFKDLHFSAIYSSDLLRAQRTAEIIKLDRELEIKTSQFLRERSYGSFEGKSASEYRVYADGHLKKIQQLNKEEQWQYKFAADIESNAELMSRFVTYLREIALAHLGEKVLVVSHGGALRTFLMHLGYMEEGKLPIGSLGNGGYIEVESDGVTFEIKKVTGLLPTVKK